MEQLTPAWRWYPLLRARWPCSAWCGCSAPNRASPPWPGLACRPLLGVAGWEVGRDGKLTAWKRLLSAATAAAFGTLLIALKDPLGLSWRSAFVPCG